jgi:hypothetical protein
MRFGASNPLKSFVPFVPFVPFVSFVSLVVCVAVVLGGAQAFAQT